MNKLTIYMSCLLIGMTGTSLHAQDLPSAPTGNTLLWEISGNGLKKPSYFLGTMHILCPEDAFLSSSVKAIIENVNAVYFEIDLDNMAQMMGAMRAMTMLNDTTLNDLLTKEEVDRLKVYLEDKVPFPFGMISRFKPMMIASMLSEQMLPCKAGSGTEMLIMAEASKRKLPTNGLETAAYQMGLFDSIPYAIQAKELVKVLDNNQEEKQTEEEITSRMLKAFQEQNLDALYKLTMQEEAGISGYEDLLIFNRNRNWIAQFPEICTKGSFLFAVGAGHLPGEQGVLNLLKSKGYTLRPLLNEKPAP